MCELPDLTSATALHPAAVAALEADGRRIVIVGAGGWIGRAAMRGLHTALGGEAFAARVLAFGSSARTIDLFDGIFVEQHPLSALAELPRQQTLLFHLAFLTKDKVAAMDRDEYCAANRALSTAVYRALDPIGVDRVFVASSGAAAYADDPEASDDLRLYGALKKEDEDRFAGWAEADITRRAIITRIYSLSGPYINKHNTYALASFIVDALTDRPIAVRAPMRVLRSYVAIRELVSLVLVQSLRRSGGSVFRYDSGGLPFELAEVAAEVAIQLGGSVERALVSVTNDNVYTGSSEPYASMLKAAGIPAMPLAQQIRETAVTLVNRRDSG